jgi:MFS family permease
MAFFGNTAVNRLNLHYALHAVALSGGGAFYAAFLLKAGVPPAGVLLAIAAILIGRFVIRPAVVPLCVRFGIRRVLIAGTVMTALQYPILAEVDGVGWALLALIVAGAIADTVYWSTYHAYFAALGDDDHRGHQLGAREAMAALAGIASPLLTGWLLVSYGPRVAFGASAVIVALSAAPLFLTPDIAVQRNAPGAVRAALPGLLLFMADGLVASGFHFVWQLALFVSLDKNLMAYGGALAIAALVGAVAGLFLGRHIDAGHGGRAVTIAFGLMAAIVVLRAFAADHAAFAVAANALGAFGGCLYVPALMTAVYTQAKRAPCVLRFHVVAEGGWDMGGALGLLCAALLLYAGLPLWSGVLLALAGIAIGWWMLRRYYRDNPRVAIDAIAPEAVHPAAV